MNKKHIWRGEILSNADGELDDQVFGGTKHKNCTVIHDSAGIPVKEAIALALAMSKDTFPFYQDPIHVVGLIQKYIRAAERLKKKASKP